MGLQLPLFLSLAKIGERRPLRNKGTAVGLLLRSFREISAVHRQRTATHVVKSPQVRHDSVAQIVNTLLRTVPTGRHTGQCYRRTGEGTPALRLNKTDTRRLYSQVLDVISRLTSCAALLCRTLRRVADLCSSNLSDTANKSRHGGTLCSPTVEKILCRSPIVSVLQISPCPLREKG